MFYIVKKGILHMNCEIDVEMYNKVPVSVDEWKLLKTIKTVEYRIKTLTTGDFIVSSNEIRDCLNVCATVVSVHISEVYYIN